MDRKQHLEFCKICANKKSDYRYGIICGLTQKKADFEGECKFFISQKSDLELKLKSKFLFLKINCFEINDFFKQEALSLIKDGKCPYTKMKIDEINYFCLAGRYMLASEDIKFTGLQIQIKNKYVFQAAYVPISKEIFFSYKNKIELNMSLGSLFVIIAMISLFLIIISKFFMVMTGLIPILILLMLLFIPGFMCLHSVKQIKNDISEEIVNTNSMFSYAGVPDYDDRDYLDLITGSEMRILLLRNKILIIEDLNVRFNKHEI